MSTSSIASTLASTARPTTSSTPATSTASGLQSLTPQNFIQLMVTQLKNQDPTQPTSNEEILQQMSEIGQLQSTDTLQTNLQAMVLQNSIGSASNLIGKSVQGADATGATITGTVNSISVASGAVSLQLDSGKTLALANVTNIATPAPASTGTATSTTASPIAATTTASATGA